MNEYKKIENKYNLLINNLEFFNAYQKLLYLVIALETVFVFDNESKSNAVSSKVSNLIAKPEYKNDIEKFIKNIYNIRSSIVHSGIEYISKEKIITLTQYTRLALYNLLLINYEFNNEINKLQQKRYN
ncbi:HEPN domain-containing protein [uncultured Methanobrevibacter sp.]|uniref:HEPN domain-containing protein n=1 Tax=uncultured Methanobrevibacter sp. TaxID=253161 RepID=UPI0026DEF4B5|nr:HEPN domain-containing protein [uncultured Methanobrevibacter sp.]